MLEFDFDRMLYTIPAAQHSDEEIRGALEAHHITLGRELQLYRP